MHSPIVSQINQVSDCTEDLPYTDTSSLIIQLSDPNDHLRLQAREVLTCIGEPAIHELLMALSNANTQLRWEIIKVFEGIQNVETIPVLVKSLKNENAGVRWAASNALISFKRVAIPAILQALMNDSDSAWLRQSAHHILHVLKDDGNLTASEEKVYAALEDIEPTASVPWAAQRALDYLQHEKR